MEKYSPDKKSLVMTREQVRAFDSWAINTLGIPGVVLMENAGRSCAELIKEKLVDLAMPYGSKIATPKICIFCGTGNNGGDGYVIARHLLNNGYEVSVIIAGDRSKIKGDAKTNLDILEKLGPLPRLASGDAGAGRPAQQFNLDEGDIARRVKDFADGADMLVDALFGTGLKGPLSEPFRQLIESINACNRPILAVDIPSGLDCDTGEPLGAAVKAAYTVTFVAVKKGFTSPAAAKYLGEIFVASIGVEPDSYPGV